MRLLYCDETNLNPADFDFFVYGGIVVDCAAAASLSAAIESIRLTALVPSTFNLKFHPRPTHLNNEQFAQLKRAVIQAGVDHGCRFITSLILHNIATSPEDARLKEINRVAYHFNCYLQTQSDHGLVLIDQFSNNQANPHLREKFQVGITGMPYSRQMRLERILGFHYAAIGQSHFGSLIDIVIGCFRFAVNAHTRGQTGNLATAATLLGQLSPLFDRSSTGHVPETCLFFSPKVVTSPTYLSRYQSLKDFLAANGIHTQQQITHHRTY